MDRQLESLQKDIVQIKEFIAETRPTIKNVKKDIERLEDNLMPRDLIIEMKKTIVKNIDRVEKMNDRLWDITDKNSAMRYKITGGIIFVNIGVSGIFGIIAALGTLKSLGVI